jgi:hypothetical protein
MTENRTQLTDADVWTLMEAGCNTYEIAWFAAVSLETAKAMMVRARCVHVRSA